MFNDVIPSGPAKNFVAYKIKNDPAKNKKPKPNFTTVFGSNLRLANATQTNPNKGANSITKNALDTLFTIFGSIVKNNKLLSKFPFANNDKDPPLCSKKAKKIIENAMNNNAAINFFLAALDSCLDNS